MGENRAINNLATLKSVVAVETKQNNKAISLVGDLVATIPDGQRELQRELSITISKVEDGLARMFMGREQARLTSNSEEDDSDTDSSNDVKPDLKIVGDNEDDSMSLDGLANFDWDSSDNDENGDEDDKSIDSVTEDIPVTKTSPDDATPTVTVNTPETAGYTLGF